MIRKFSAVLAALALASCFSRAAAWAAISSHGDAHACCRHGAPAKVATLNDCCVTTAATSAVRLVRIDGSATAVAPLLLPAPFAFVGLRARTAAPPGVRAYRAAVPARAPPLA